jgi:hypothetical protein
MDRILLTKGQTIKIGGIPFELESDTVVLGDKDNLNLMTAAEGTHKLFGVSSVLYDAQSTTSDNIKPSSASMYCLK